MALLYALRALAARHRWKLAVAHFNHQLRGRNSDADEQLVRKTAAAMKLPLVTGRADVKRLAEQSKLSIEMAARKLRHEFFARAAKKRGIRPVALAHHADDQVELFFLRLLRGAGTEGLAGMKWRSPSPVNSNITLIRPLLDLTKAELQDFARAHKIRFREDATNFSCAAPRNRLRNELLPLLRRRYQPALTKTVLRLMQIAGAESDFAGAAAQQWLCRRRGNESQTKRSETPYVVSGSFANLPVAVQRRVLRLQLAGAGVAADFELVEQLREAPGKFISVSSNLSAARNAAGRIELRRPLAREFHAAALKLNLPGRSGRVAFGGVQFRWALKNVSGSRGSAFAGPRRDRRSPHQTEFFDADKVGGRITLRHWRPGDRFQPIGMKSALKLQDWFVNQKIPRPRRHALMVATAAAGEIFWIEGLRIGERFKVTPQTQRRLIWRWQRAETGKRR